MGTLMGHLAPGLSFTLLGLWHLLNTVTSYKLSSAGAFASRPWFPIATATAALKHLELHILLLLSLLAIASQLLQYPITLLSLEHSTMFLHLVLYTTASLAGAPVGLSGALAASAFAQELLLLHFHSADHVGLEGHYHFLLQLVVAVSMLAAATAAVLPASFAAAAVRSAAVMLQGLWFVVMGLALWVPRFVPRGCYVAAAEAEGENAVACVTEEAARRAMAMANLQFSWMVAIVATLMAVMCLRPDCKCTAEYRRLQSGRVVDCGQVSGEVKVVESGESNVTV